MTDPHRLRLLVLIVAYEAEATIAGVLERIPPGLAERFDVEILVIDDASHDGTFARAQASRGPDTPFPLHVLVNPQNQGYGGNQKIGFHFALERGFDAVALVHGDGQYAPECLPDLLEPLRAATADAVMGSRMMTRGGARAGGMPLYKRVGNRLLTALQNAILRARLSEYHSGYRLYATAALRRIPFDLNSNGFDFDTEIIVQLLIAGQRIRELPIPTHYGDEISRVNVFGYGWRVLVAAAVARLQEVGLFYDRKYDCRPGDPEARLDLPRLDYDSPHRRALALLRPGARVLLLGRGHRFADVLRERGCSVTAIDGPAGLVRRRPAELPNDDGPGPEDLPGSLDAFDVVLLLDGLDRVHAPERFVDRLREAARRAPHVTVMVSSANVGFVVTRLMLLAGQFNYGLRGILDMSHHRLFTARSLRRLLEQGGFMVTAVHGVPVPFPVVFGDGPAGRLLLALNRVLIRLSRSLFAYQIVAVATPRLSLDQLLAAAETRSQDRLAAEPEAAAVDDDGRSTPSDRRMPDAGAARPRYDGRS
ncbi:bifunctional glycosyltransferase/class I SAM-dependent methyltransferase [Rhodoplanes roseus]|uniref:Glycosyltransferase 2-like domain-containing protein n=1 Tax=Rhodoplanes roseus TaxID=29409 RepID=A0A327L5T9_9BRAD|nr:bifunctional glycosyltransferase/class I SAM-dependent methyltransferase [Rhodoplanes roseus]RAI45706.1 hypothetical protein CH341_02485 [Rhodoplanes roseus]